MPVGVEDGRIPNGALTASSYYSENYHPSRASFNSLSSKYCWAAKKNDANQWLQVCFHLFSPFAFHCNKPLPSFKNPHFQNEARCTTFLVKMSFTSMRMKNDFHTKGWAPKLVLKQRPGGTRKWPIGGLALATQNPVSGRSRSLPVLFLFTYKIEVLIERFHMTSRRPYWCSKTMKRWPCWYTKTTLRVLNSSLM